MSDIVDDLRTWTDIQGGHLAASLRTAIGEIERLRADAEQLRTIVEKKMTLHWDMEACECWLCKAGRRVKCHPRSEYLAHNAPADTYIGDAECPKSFWKEAAEAAGGNDGD